MEISQIQLFDLFRSKFGDKEAEAFVNIIEEKMDTRIDQRKHELATKEDVNRLREDMLAMKVELKDDMSTLRSELKDDMSTLRSDLRAEMGTLRADLTRSIYVTSLGQLFAIVATVISLVVLLLRK